MKLKRIAKLIERIIAEFNRLDVNYPFVQFHMYNDRSGCIITGRSDGEVILSFSNIHMSNSVHDLAVSELDTDEVWCRYIMPRIKEMVEDVKT